MAEFKFNPKVRSKGSGRSPRRSNDRRDSPYSKGRDSGRSDFGRRSSGRRDFERRDSAPIERTKVICDSCGEECEVPFKPSSNKPVYCDNCFKKNSDSRSSNSSKELKEINEKLDKILKALEIEN